MAPANLPDFEFDAVITHAAEDAPVVTDLLEELEREGRQVTARADAAAAADPDGTAEVLRRSRRVLGLISASYCSGWWCREGATMLEALPDRAIRLVPVLFPDLRGREIPTNFRARPGLTLERDDQGGFQADQLAAVAAVVGANHVSDESTVLKLHRWFDGDEGALEELLGDNLAWMQTYVRKHLNPRLRRRFDSMDVVQEGAMRILRYSPKHPPANRAQLRALFKKALLDALRDKIDHLQAGRRNIDREESIHSAVASNDRPIGQSSEDQPDAVAEKQELREWVKLALEFLDPLDREIILRRDYHKEPFEVIAEAVGIATPDAARMRYNRALPKLAWKIRELRSERAERRASDSEFSI